MRYLAGLAVVVAVAATVLAWPILRDQAEYLQARWRMAITVSHVQHERRMQALEQRSADAVMIARWQTGKL